MARALLLALTMVQGGTTQSGDLDDRIRYSVVSRPEIGARTGPLSLVLLWRGESGWTLARSPAESRQLDSLTRWRYVSNSTAVLLSGKTIPLATHPDSALVVMVDLAKPDSERTASAMIGSRSVPPEFWPKTWRSGDTTFTVSPQYPRRMSMLWNALGTSPAIANFLLFDPKNRTSRVATTRMVERVSVEEKAVADFIPAVPAVDTGGACAPYPVPGFRGIRMLSYRFGPADQVRRRVMVGIDSLGRVTTYSDLRGSATTGPSPARDAGPGTVVSFSATSVGIFGSNLNSETMPGSFLLFGDQALKAPNLGPIGPMIDRIKKECDR